MKNKNNTTLRNRYKIQNKQYYTAGTGTKSKTNNTTLPEQVQNEKQTILHCQNRYKTENKQYYTAGTGTTSKTNNTTLPEQVQHQKQTILHCRNRYNIKKTILHCRNRYNIKNKQYYIAGTGTK